MQALPFFDVILDALVWVVGIVGAVLAFIFQPVRIAAALGNAVMQLVMRLAKIRAVEEVVNTRRLPSDGTVKTAEHFAEAAANRAHRIQFYLDLRRHKKAARHGPYALLMLIEDWFAADFQDWQQAIRSEVAVYDRLEERARGALYAFERERAAATTALDRRLDRLEARHWLAARAFKDLAASVGRERSWARLRRSLRKARRLRGTMRRLRRWILAAQRDRRDAVAAVDRRHGRRLELALVRLTGHEERRLLHQAQLFRADWLSQELTVECGRTVERLMCDTPTCRRIRASLKLVDLPWRAHDLDAWLTERIGGRVAMSPDAQIEDRMEVFLRLHLQALPPGATPVDPDWIDRLAPPGIFGLGQERFGSSADWRPAATPPAVPQAASLFRSSAARTAGSRSSN